MRWEPIETIPEAGAFLVFMPTASQERKIQVMIRHKNITTIGNHFDFDMPTPTHWMQPPEAPDAS